MKKENINDNVVGYVETEGTYRIHSLYCEWRRSIDFVM